MDEAQVERILVESERALATSRRPDLTALGFWRAVAAVKRSPDLVRRHADRIGAIDRESFQRQVRLRFPVAAGLVLDLLGVGVGKVLLWLAFFVPSPQRELAILAGMGAVLVGSHTLVHYVVGRLLGIRFSHWFFVPPLRPQPGFKTDYASYLRTPARARAWMHASGAIVSKLVPFLTIPVALAAGAQSWAIWVLIAIAFGQLVTDAVFSTRASDWKRFRREMRAA